MRQMESGRVAVSYLLTTRNRCAFVEERIRNVREFIRPQDEFLIFDAASTDGTQEMVARHRDVVTHFVSEPDRGEAHGFNKAILASRGDIIKVLTDDDHFYPDAMRRAVEVMEGDPEIDALVCGGEAFLGAGANERFWLNFKLPPEVAKVDLEAVFRYLNCGLGLFFRHRAVPLVGLFDATFAAVDTQFLSQLVRCRVNLRYMDVRLFKHTRHPHSTSGNEGKIQRDIVRALMDAGEWEMLFGFGLPFLRHAPGIDRLKRRQAYISIVMSLRRMEDAGAGWCVSWFAICLAALRAVVRLGRKISGRRHVPSSSVAPNEPSFDARWSGKLV